MGLLGTFVGEFLLQLRQDGLTDAFDGFFDLLQSGGIVGVVFFEFLAKTLGHLVNEGLAVEISFHGNLRREGIAITFTVSRETSFRDFQKLPEARNAPDVRGKTKSCCEHWNPGTTPASSPSWITSCPGGSFIVPN